MEPQSLSLELLEFGVVACRAAVDDHGGLMAGLFVAGLVGSLSHCVGMCGPFVLAQVMTRLEGVPASEMSELKRLSGAVLVPYHLGRATTYMALGAAAAALAGGFVQLSGMKMLSGILLLTAAVLFAGYGLRRLGVPLPAFSSSSGGFTERFGGWVKPLLANPVGWRGYALGVLLGFIPCGLLYGGLAAAASAGGALAGALAMGAFAAGTVPALLGVGLVGHIVGGAFSGVTGRVAPVLLLINAALLSYMAWRLLN